MYLITSALYPRNIRVRQQSRAAEQRLKPMRGRVVDVLRVNEQQGPCSAAISASESFVAVER
jgi:hypothetical protein